MSYVQGARPLVIARAPSVKAYAVLRVQKPSGTIYEEKVTSGLDPLEFVTSIDTSDEAGEYNYQFTIGKTIKRGKFRVRPEVPAGTLVIPPPPPASTPPPAIANQGYTMVFDDEFDTFNRAVWDDRIWYDADPPQVAWVGFQEATDGVLHLRTSRDFIWHNEFSDPPSSGSYPRNTITTQTAGIVFKYGYFEAKMKWTKGNGAWPAFWLYSYRHATNPNYPAINPICAALGEPNSHCVAGEIDIFEGQGAEPNAYYGTIHTNSSGVYNDIVAETQNPNSWHPVPLDLTADFHKYAVLWTPTTVTWYLDDKELMSYAAYESLNQPMFVLLQMWAGGWTAGIDSTTPDTIETQVDHVRIWQKP